MTRWRARELAPVEFTCRLLARTRSFIRLPRRNVATYLPTLGLAKSAICFDAVATPGPDLAAHVTDAFSKTGILHITVRGGLTVLDGGKVATRSMNRGTGKKAGHHPHRADHEQQDTKNLFHGQER